MSDPSTSRRPFTAYALPRPARRQGPATFISLLAHAAVAALVLWRGATVVTGGGGGLGPRGGGGGGGGPDRPVVSWFALPPAEPAADAAVELPLPAVSVTMVAIPTPEIAQIDVRAAIAVAPASAGGGTASGGQGPGTGGGQGGGAGPGRGTGDGPGSGGDASYIFPASPRWTIIPPQGAPRDARGRRHEVRFWVAADGRVTRIEVIPPIKDAGYRREFVERMMAYQFNPATTRDGRRVASVARVTVIP